MPVPLTLQVNAPSNTSIGDGTQISALSGKQGDLLVSQLHGKYYNQTYRSNVFYAATAAVGVSNTIFSNTAYQGLLVWNPQGSGKNLSMIRFTATFNTVSVTAAAGFGYAWIGNAGAGLATAAPISAITLLTATRGSCYLAPTAGQANSVAICGVAATLTTALLWGRNASFSALTGGINTLPSTAGMIEEFDGTMVVPPGTAFFTTTNILSGGGFSSSLIWEEVPI